MPDKQVGQAFTIQILSTDSLNYKIYLFEVL